MDTKTRVLITSGEVPIGLSPHCPGERIPSIKTLVRHQIGLIYRSAANPEVAKRI